MAQVALTLRATPPTVTKHRDETGCLACGTPVRPAPAGPADGHAEAGSTLDGFPRPGAPERHWQGQQGNVVTRASGPRFRQVTLGQNKLYPSMVWGC